MTAASIEFQKALVSVLSSDAGVTSALPTIKIDDADVVPIFDKVPAEVMDMFRAGTGPTYISIGEGTETFDLAGEVEDEDHYVEIEDIVPVIHIWSQTIGMLQAKTLARAICQAMKAAYAAGALVLPTNRILSFDPARIEASRAEDGVTSHAAVVLRLKTQSTS